MGHRKEIRKLTFRALALRRSESECSVSEPSGIKKWKEHFPNSFLDWKRNFTRIYQITKDNKLRQFLFKILHRIIITKKELKKFDIETDNHCNFCPRPDSIMHTFLECDVSISLFSSTIKWFNDVHKLNVSPSVEQILFNSTDEIASLTSIQKRRLDLLLLLIKHYLYSCKVFCKNPNIFLNSNQTSIAMENRTLFTDLIL